MTYYTQSYKCSEAVEIRKHSPPSDDGVDLDDLLDESSSIRSEFLDPDMAPVNGGVLRSVSPNGLADSSIIPPSALGCCRRRMGIAGGRSGRVLGDEGTSDDRGATSSCAAFL